MSGSTRRPWLARALAEALLVVFAVLVALAVDEWWEGRENAALAERTLEAVANEMRRNREQLLDRGAVRDPTEVMADLAAAIEAVRDGREPESLSVNWDFALLSSAAWETAQLTRTTQFMELDRVVDVAQVYELQRYVQRTQEELASLIAGFGGRMESEPVVALTELQAHFATANALRGTLVGVYACTLLELEGPGAVEEGACPREGEP